MNQKDPIRVAVSVLFIVIAIGIRVAWNQMQPPAPSSALGAFQTQNPSLAKIEFATNHGAKDLVTVKDGMTFAQVKDAFRLVSVGEAEPMITNDPEVLAVFLNPDGSSIEIIFRHGIVAAKQIYNLQETLDNAKNRR